MLKELHSSVLFSKPAACHSTGSERLAGAAAARAGGTQWLWEKKGGCGRGSSAFLKTVLKQSKQTKSKTVSNLKSQATGNEKEVFGFRPWGKGPRRLVNPQVLPAGLSPYLARPAPSVNPGWAALPPDTLPFTILSQRLFQTFWALPPSLSSLPFSLPSHGDIAGSFLGATEREASH